MPEPQWSPYEYPELDVKEYNKKLEAFLMRRFRAGQLVVEGKRLKPQNEKHGDIAEAYIAHLTDQTTLEGVNPRLPFYNEVVTATMTPEWYGGQVGQYMGDWAQWGEEQARTKERDWQREFGVQQWQQSEAWRRYGAETQQQRWQAEQKAQRQQQWWGLAQQREMTREAAYNWGQQRYAHQLGGAGGEWSPAGAGQYGTPPPAGQLQGMAQAWDVWNQHLASGATWPQSEILSTQVNPYERTPESIGDEIQQSKSEYDFAKQKADWFRKRMKDPDDPLTKASLDFLDPEAKDPAGMTPDQWAALGAFTAEAVTKKQYEGTMTSREAQDWSGWKGKQEARREKERELGWGETWGRDRPARPAPQMPKTPAFLREVYPELGERLPRDKAQAPMGVLSGQQWTGLSPSERGQWAGYVGWAGGKPEDLYAQMRGALPQPRRGGAWTPARQWRG